MVPPPNQFYFLFFLGGSPPDPARVATPSPAPAATPSPAPTPVPIPTPHEDKYNENFEKMRAELITWYHLSKDNQTPILTIVTSDLEGRYYRENESKHITATVYAEGSRHPLTQFEGVAGFGTREDAFRDLNANIQRLLFGREAGKTPPGVDRLDYWNEVGVDARVPEPLLKDSYEPDA